ncbi:CRAL-TRIO domain-containing protein [Aphelenchoides bicaudatus]|nr:CRAL-TRIO domain-containing protein [Aphelenchoides bicaudatus]
MPDQLVRPEPFSEAELERSKVLRSKLDQILPDELKSDFFLCRWLRAYNGNESIIEEKLKELIAHREAFGYTESNIIQFCEDNTIARKTFERFAISQLKMDVFSEDVAVFIQKMEHTDLKQIVKIMPLSNVLHSYFFLQTAFQRAIHEHEQKIGRPAAVIVVLDLQGLNLTDFLNPLSASTKLARLVVKIWSDYFSENMIRLFLIHPPALLSVMWQIAKHIVDAKTQSRIAFLPKLEDIFNHLHKESVPEDWGGSRRDDSGYAPVPSSCVRFPLQVKEEDVFTPENFWKKQHGFSMIPDTKTVSLKSKNVHEVLKECTKDQKLVWQFTVNSDITFEIVWSGTESQPDYQNVWPKVTLTSLKTPEIGSLICPKTGIYRLRFANVSSSFFSSKLQYCVQAK